MRRAQCILAVTCENDISLILMALYWPPSHVFQTRYSRIAWVEDAGGCCLRWVKFSSHWSGSSVAHSSVSASLYTRGQTKMELSHVKWSITRVGLMIWSLCLFDFLHYFCLRSKCYNLHRARALWGSTDIRGQWRRHQETWRPQVGCWFYNLLLLQILTFSVDV